MLEANNISVVINKQQLLDKASIRCQPGQFIALCGPNGAGKSTFLHALAGHQSFQSGEVTINKKPIGRYNSESLARVRAVMPQSVELNFHFLIRDVIEMGMIFTESQRQRNLIVDRVSELLSLQRLLDKPYPQCSGGEKQRAQLARVIAQLLQAGTESNRYLLLDESTSAMDLAMMHQALQVITEVKRNNIGIIAVLHDLNLASRYADHMVFVSNKTTSHQGEPKQLVTTENISSVFSAMVTVIRHPQLDHPLVV